MIEPVTIPDIVIQYWRERGYNVGEGGEALVNGMPASIKTVTTRPGNARPERRAALLEDLYDLGLCRMTKDEFDDVCEDIENRALTELRLNAIESGLRRARSKSMIDEIFSQVCEKYGYSRDELKSDARNRSLAKARFELYYRLRHEVDGLSYPRIGRLVGGRDHGSVIHGIRRHEESMAGDAL